MTDKVPSFQIVRGKVDVVEDVEIFNYVPGEMLAVAILLTHYGHLRTEEWGHRGGQDGIDFGPPISELERLGVDRFNDMSTVWVRDLWEDEDEGDSWDLFTHWWRSGSILHAVWIRTVRTTAEGPVDNITVSFVDKDPE